MVWLQGVKFGCLQCADQAIRHAAQQVALRSQVAGQLGLMVGHQDSIGHGNHSLRTSCISPAALWVEAQ